MKIEQYGTVKCFGGSLCVCMCLGGLKGTSHHLLALNNRITLMVIFQVNIDGI